MKKSIFMLVVAMITIVGSTHAQFSKNETGILYFKANLSCCKARACNALEADVRSVIEKYFADKNISFKVVKLADEANKALIEKYNAKSQTVVIVKKKKRKETVTDVSAIVRNYAIKKDKEMFEKELKNKISECLK